MFSSLARSEEVRRGQGQTPCCRVRAFDPVTCLRIDQYMCVFLEIEVGWRRRSRRPAGIISDEQQGRGHVESSEVVIELGLNDLIGQRYPGRAWRASTGGTRRVQLSWPRAAAAVDDLVVGWTGGEKLETAGLLHHDFGAPHSPWLSKKPVAMAVRSWLVGDARMKGLTTESSFMASPASRAQ